MRRVIVESPFAGRGGSWSYLEPESQARSQFVSRNDAKLNLAYAKSLCRYLALRGDAPYASHVFATQFLNDELPEERICGIELGLFWGVCAQVSVVGVDRGLTRGMCQGIEHAKRDGRAIEWVSLPEWASSWLPEGVDRDAWKAYGGTL
jgi:hypothetical protein